MGEKTVAHNEELKNVWVCHECGKDYFFYSDVEEHTETTGHRKIKKYDPEILEKGGIIGKQ